ncbi:hypothetical protein DS86501_17 [Lactococcus phage 86501]|uniref:DUF658 family protein n=2 Tax=root TaxID=1 RepID=UPI0008094038|nr:DUF658 family protein [Lactococcus phage 50101]ANS02409.1 hypothetical protein DS50101_17 [Lactococcus phage 50101]ANS02662.1 hypothetical protein DS86501_17 [Lactococcus phage 86501]
MSKTEKSKGYSLFVDGKLVAKGSRESFSAKYGVSLATVDTWVKKGRLPLRKRMPLKHAVPFGYENSDEVPPVRKSPGKKGIAKKVYSVYQSGRLLGTGTADELAEQFHVKKQNVYFWISKGKLDYDQIGTVKYAVFNETETKKRFPQLDTQRNYDLSIDERKEKERRKHETKEERRLRRNIRAQMAIENSRKEELGL